MEEKNTGYLKTMKNGIVSLSSIVFVINVLFSNDFLSILLNSFTYISSQGLTFYSIDPKTEKSKNRRDLLVKVAIWLVIIIIGFLIVVNKVAVNKSVNYVCIIITKILLIIFSLLVVSFSFADGSQQVTTEELNLGKKVKRELNEQYEQDEKAKLYSERNKRVKKNEETRKFVLKKKSKKKEDLK